MSDTRMGVSGHGQMADLTYYRSQNRGISVGSQEMLNIQGRLPVTSPRKPPETRQNRPKIGSKWGQIGVFWGLRCQIWGILDIPLILYSTRARGIGSYDTLCSTYVHVCHKNWDPKNRPQSWPTKSTTHGTNQNHPKWTQWNKTKKQKHVPLHITMRLN